MRVILFHSGYGQPGDLAQFEVPKKVYDLLVDLYGEDPITIGSGLNGGFEITDASAPWSDVKAPPLSSAQVKNVIDLYHEAKKFFTYDQGQFRSDMLMKLVLKLSSTEVFNLKAVVGDDYWAYSGQDKISREWIFG